MVTEFTVTAPEAVGQLLRPEEIQTLSETDEGVLLVSQFDAFVQ